MEQKPSIVYTKDGITKEEKVTFFRSEEKMMKKFFEVSTRNTRNTFFQSENVLKLKPGYEKIQLKNWKFSLYNQIYCDQGTELILDNCNIEYCSSLSIEGGKSVRLIVSKITTIYTSNMNINISDVKEDIEVRLGEDNDDASFTFRAIFVLNCQGNILFDVNEISIDSLWVKLRTELGCIVVRNLFSLYSLKLEANHIIIENSNVNCTDFRETSIYANNLEVINSFIWNDLKPICIDAKNIKLDSNSFLTSGDCIVINDVVYTNGEFGSITIDADNLNDDKLFGEVNLISVLKTISQKLNQELEKEIVGEQQQIESQFMEEQRLIDEQQEKLNQRKNKCLQRVRNRENGILSKRPIGKFNK